MFATLEGSVVYHPQVFRHYNLLQSTPAEALTADALEFAIFLEDNALKVRTVLECLLADFHNTAWHLDSLQPAALETADRNSLERTIILEYHPPQIPALTKCAQTKCRDVAWDYEFSEVASVEAFLSDDLHRRRDSDRLYVSTSEHSAIWRLD